MVCTAGLYIPITDNRSGFKKNLNRVGTQVMQKAGAMERTVDREFEEEERRYKTMEASSLKLQKEAKAYLDSLRAMTAAQSRIAETIDAFQDERSASATSGRQYKLAVEQLDTQCVKELDGPYRTTVLDPIGRFCAYFPEVNEAIKKRNKKLLDYDSARSKVKKLTDKPSDDAKRLPVAEKFANDARDLYVNLNNQLVTELPQLIDLRIPYLDPSFEAMVKIQLRFCEEGYETLTNVQQYFDPQVREDYASGVLDQRVEGVLQEMRDLSICGLDR